MKTILALLALGVTLALPTHTARCQSFCATGVTCYGNVACGKGCICIQPNGPGSEGWCN